MKSLLDTRSENLFTGPALLLAVAAIYYVKLLALLPLVAVIYVALALYQSKLNLKSVFEGRRGQVIFITSGMLILGYTLSEFYSAQSYGLKFYAYLLYGPALLTVAVFAYALEKEGAGLQALEKYLPYLVAFQISALVFNDGIKSLREIAAGQLFFFPFVMYLPVRRNAWLKYIFIVLTVPILALTEERIFLVTGAFEFFIVTIYLCRHHYKKMIASALLVLLAMGVAVTFVTKDQINWISSHLPMVKRYVSADMSNANGPSNPIYAADRLGLVLMVVEMTKNHSVLGYSTLVPFNESLASAGACQLEYFKHMGCDQPHAHNFFAKQIYTIGIFSLAYVALIFFVLISARFSAYSIATLSIFLVFGLAESPSPFLLYFLLGSLLCVVQKNPLQDEPTKITYN